jgi:hypothetical protein
VKQAAAAGQLDSQVSPLNADLLAIPPLSNPRILMYLNMIIVSLLANALEYLMKYFGDILCIL